LTGIQFQHDAQRQALPQFGNLMLCPPGDAITKGTKFSYDCKDQLIFGQADN